MSVQNHADKVVFTLAFRSDKPVDGYLLRLLPDQSPELLIKRRPVLTAGAKPLSGITVMLDPGHGGTALGALGPLGAALPEKQMTLAIAREVKRELEARGARVLMTRQVDRDVSLEARLEMSRQALPDLFLSIHINSLASTADASRTTGVVALYKDGFGGRFAEKLYKDYAADLGSKKSGLRWQNLYVCRGYWTPSALLECGFLSQPSEFEWLSSEAGRQDIAQAVAASVTSYFE